MAKLAILGHKTRGKEVIEILEMLGGITYENLSGVQFLDAYYITDDKRVEWTDYPAFKDSLIFSLEEFLEKFPYKVGDKVSSKYLKNYKIEKMEWEDTNNRVIYKLQGMGWYSVDELQPYKEEIMEENNEKSANHVFDTEVITFDIAQRDKYELDLQGKFEVVLREGKYYVERIKPKYPKTYKECCEVLNTYCTIPSRPGYKEALIAKFQELLICRDAYWKIAGERMGLGKAWEPDYLNPTKETLYFFFCTGDTIENGQALFPTNKIFIFPTEEMRDAYKENFDNDIEICKEFL